MGLFDTILGRRPLPKGKYEGSYKLLDGYKPNFTRWGGELYESELVRAAINARATHISKLDVTITGKARPALVRKLKAGPNQFQTWSQFLYRLSTILDIHNTAFIVPIYDRYGEPSGIYAPVPYKCEIVQYGGKPYLRYEFAWGEKAAIEQEYCGIMTKMQYRNDFFGETNAAMYPTMELINLQNQGIEEGVKSSASYSFIARLSNFAKSEDVKRERIRFSEENFSKDAKASGILLFPNTYSDIKQVITKPWVVDSEQMKVIRSNVFEYFGVNESILTNDYDPEKWSAFYEGAIESWACQFSQVLTKMFFTIREQNEGNSVTASANRIQYMSNADKLNVSAQMADRGLMTRNEIRQIWNLPPLPSEIGDQLPVRGEYYNIGADNEAR